MKTLVFYIFNGISFNAQDFFIRQLAASGSDLFGLKFYAPWVMLTGNVHHEARAMDIIELTGLATPGELYEPDCQLHRNAVESIFHKPEPNMSQMLSMMKPLPSDAEYPT